MGELGNMNAKHTMTAGLCILIQELNCTIKIVVSHVADTGFVSKVALSLPQKASESSKYMLSKFTAFMTALSYFLPQTSSSNEFNCTT